jgi:hypothetical protein
VGLWFVVLWLRVLFSLKWWKDRYGRTATVREGAAV